MVEDDSIQNKNNYTMIGFYAVSLQKMTTFIKYTIFKSFFMYKNTCEPYTLNFTS